MDEKLHPLEKRKQVDVKLADYDIGFQAGLDGEPRNLSKTEDWLRGWFDAQEPE